MTHVTFTTGTYEVKEELKALGARFNANARGWDVPVEKMHEAADIIRNLGAREVVRKAEEALAAKAERKEEPEANPITNAEIAAIAQEKLNEGMSLDELEGWLTDNSRTIAQDLNLTQDDIFDACDEIMEVIG